MHISFAAIHIYLSQEKDVSNMADEHTLAEQKGHTMMHIYIYINIYGLLQMIFIYTFT